MRSLSRKGNPYDNAVAESTYKSFKFEFVYGHTFHTLYELQVQLMDYVHWWNPVRPHGSLDYETPIDYREGWEQEQSENAENLSHSTIGRPLSLKTDMGPGRKGWSCPCSRGHRLLH